MIINRIDKTFKELKKKRQKAFIVYITAGYPNMKATKGLMSELDRRGADIIELGIPFSDPVADGPVIQESSYEAVKKGVTIGSILRMLGPIRHEINAALVFMTYYNPVLQYGIKRFVRDSKKSGIDGVIVPDLPWEESQELSRIGKEHDFSVILLASPTSTAERLKFIASRSSGFIYYVALTGVTGTRTKVADDLSANIRKLKALTTKPICAGFGVSNAAQAAAITGPADGVIVGSALIRVIMENRKSKDMIYKVGKFASSIARGVKYD